MARSRGPGASSRLKTAIEYEQVVSELRATNQRLTRELAGVKVRTSELVKAVYEAAKDAALSLDIPPIRPPKADRRATAEEVAIAVLSDWQLAKVTATYNSKVCAERIARYADKVSEITEIQRSDHPVRECRVYLLGDLVEGELVFPGQAHLIDASLFDQVLVSGRSILSSFVRQMLGVFERVRVVGVIGNHGSLGGRARREYHPESNADAMLYETARLVLKGEDDTREPRLEWAANRVALQRRWYAVDYVGTKGFLLFHGDQVKGGYADYPWYGFGKKILRWANGGLREPFHFALSGHFHTPGRNLFGRIRHWASGSTESSNEYAAERIGNQGDPSQWLLFCKPSVRVTAEYEVDLS